ncbi:MAG TPA: gamma-glutamyltransferase [Burkholderiales bacterium]|nr:gamma-glutamyltransferase [Burkholderiales bacterium]
MTDMARLMTLWPLRRWRDWLRGAALGLAVCCTATGWAAQHAAAIASAHPLATAAGYEILERGGNAFDAAVAVAAALAVVEPYSSGLGGGGFFLLHRAADGRQVMIDGRETAPAGAVRDLYFDHDGNPVRGASTEGGKSAAIPGVPAALAHIAQHYGKLPPGESLARAIRYAREGFSVDPRYARIAGLRERLLQGGAGTAKVFLDHGRAPPPGYVLRQPELAATLERLARKGRSGFYTGPVAHALVEAVNAACGVWRLSDLEHYKIVEREPVKFSYRGATITAAALPSAGGIGLAESLGMLEKFNLSGVEQPDTAHLVVEALRRAFQDRARYLGDSDFVPVPAAGLVSKDYLKQRAATIDPDRATKSSDLEGSKLARAESGNTTHFSVIDAEGNRVAATLSINWLFGSGILSGATGVLLNNEMDDFTLRPDVPNSYRLRGSIANAIAPGKRPLSSMTPAFVEDEKGVLILGAPGGSRIISQVLLAVLEYLRSPQVDLQRLVSMPRYHHQYWPDRIEIEPEGFSPEWRAAMEARGHAIRLVDRKWGNMQVVFKARLTGEAQAASDPRGSDVGWY